jgi:hypothetical protein
MKDREKELEAAYYQEQLIAAQAMSQVRFNFQLLLLS